MNFLSVVSTAVNMVINPFSLIVSLLILAAVAATLGYRLAGARIAQGVVLYFLAILILPVDIWLTQPLENRFTPPALPDHIDGVLVLDGGADGSVMVSRNGFASESAPLRLIAGAKLLHRAPNARLIYSGRLFGGISTEKVLHIALDDLGIAPSRLTAESTSRNTSENIAFSKALAQPGPDETWVLVTSASHLPRAIGVARHLKWNMVPYASDYYTRKTYPFFGWWRAPEDRFRMLNAALHEWIGLAAYRLEGRTDTLFPAPMTGA